jgi:hypothetical protein
MTPSWCLEETAVPEKSHLLRVLLVSLAINAASRSMLAQVEPAAEGGAGSDEEVRMMTPPTVGGMPFASGANVDTRSNYVDTSLSFAPSYVSNVLPGEDVSNVPPGEAAKPISDVEFSILPSFSLVRSTPRQSEQARYSPNFTFYQHTNTLDTIDQTANAEYQYRLTPHVTATLQDNFLRTSNVFNSSYPFSNPVTGSTLTPITAVIAPFAQQLLNTTTGILSYQFAKNAMVGGAGAFTVFDFPGSSQNTDIYNSKDTEGSAFYSRRLSQSQYFGVEYEYNRSLAYPATGADETQVHSFLPFYSLYLHKDVSLTVGAGAQFVAISPFQSARYNSWSPEADLSIGWETARGGIAAGYAHMIPSGGGLLGSYTSDGVTLSAGWKPVHNWNGGVTFSYLAINNIGPVILASASTGNTLTSQATLGHSIGERFDISGGYQYLREEYNDIAIIHADPNANREFVSISCHLRKNLGR